METIKETVSIDGGSPIETVIRNPDRADWIAGPLPIAAVNVEREGHHVAIIGGKRAGWDAAAGHGISSENHQEVFLNGRQPFEPVEGDPNQAAARIVREATEGN
jgi:hypothetical protein